MTLTLSRDRLPLARVFTISRGSKTEAGVVLATVTRDGVSGRGECLAHARHGEGLDSVAAEIVDLDGPLLLARDREDPVRYEGSQMQVPRPALWGWRPMPAQGGGAAPPFIGSSNR